MMASSGRDAMARADGGRDRDRDCDVGRVFDSLGPSLPSAVLVAGLCVIAALPWNGRIAAAVSLAALAALSQFLSAMETVLKRLCPFPKSTASGWLG